MSFVMHMCLHVCVQSTHLNNLIKLEIHWFWCSVLYFFFCNSSTLYRECLMYNSFSIHHQFVRGRLCKRGSLCAGRHMPKAARARQFSAYERSLNMLHRSSTLNWQIHCIFLLLTDLDAVFNGLYWSLYVCETASANNRINFHWKKSKNIFIFKHIHLNICTL